MIDFILAGALYIAIMFVVFFSISFVTIGIAYCSARFLRRFVQWAQPSQIAVK